MSRSRDGISREDLKGTGLRDAATQLAGDDAILSEEEIDDSMVATLSHLDEAEALWIFGYGSLIWNPIFSVEECRRGKVYGFHRSFCLESTLGRGSAKRPGMMLALDSGGACTGVAMRMAASERRAELRLLWRREMMPKSYRPAWIKVHTSDGIVTALTFVAQRQSKNYLGRLSVTDVATRIAGASGLLGTNFDYLLSTCQALERNGIHDPYLQQLLSACQSIL